MANIFFLFSLLISISSIFFFPFNANALSNWERLVGWERSGEVEPITGKPMTIYIIKDVNEPCLRFGSGNKIDNKYKVKTKTLGGAKAIIWLVDVGLMSFDSQDHLRWTSRYQKWKEKKHQHKKLFWQKCNQGQQQTATRFNSPQKGGLPLDWCFTHGNQCGKGAADAFCREQGFSRSSGHRGPDMAPNKTYIIGSKKICKGSYCGSFYYIDCVH